MPTTLRDWPEAYFATAAVVVYVAVLSAYPEAFRVSAYAPKSFHLFSSIAQILVTTGLVLGTRLNVAGAPEELRPFWRWLRVVAWSLLASQLIGAVVYQIAPADYDRPGAVLSPAVIALFGLSAAAIFVAYVFLGVAVVGRVRLLASQVRSKAVILDANAGGLAMTVIGVLIFAGSVRRDSTLFAALFLGPVGIAAATLMVASLALVSLARARGGPSETEFCMAGAMLVAVFTAGNFLYQLLNPGVLPRNIAVSFVGYVLACLGSISDRREWRRGELRPAAPDVETRMMGAMGPVTLAFALPVIVLVAAAAGIDATQILIGAFGTVLVGGVVMYRLVMTLRENAALYLRAEAEKERAEAEKERAEVFAAEAEAQAEVAAALLERSTRETEDERIQLALQIHDQFLQGLSAVHMRLQAAQRRAAASGEAPTALVKGVDELGRHVEGIRELMSRLRPPVLEELGVAAALDELSTALSEVSGIEIDYETRGDIDLSTHREMALYRIAQEAIENAVQHSGTDRIRVSLVRQGERITLEVVDKGSGFRPTGEKQLLKEGKVGIASMRRRAGMGTFGIQIDARVGRGTSVRVTGAADEPRVRGASAAAG